LAISNPLEKNKSSGLHPVSFARVGDGALLTEAEDLFVPDLMSVKRCTIGIERIVEPPSVAAATEGTGDECAVQYVSIERRDLVLYISEMVKGVGGTMEGSGSAEGWEWEEGRMVRIDERDGMTVLVAFGEWERMTVVL